MRQLDLGHWHYYTWHLPALVLLALAVVVAIAASRSLKRDDLSARSRSRIWLIVGWSSLIASLLSAVSWPYLTRASSLRVDAQGNWQFRNYLGVPVGSLSAAEVRSLRGADLGGYGVGTGHLEVHRANGSVLRSVQITRDVLDGAFGELGYLRRPAMLEDRYGDRWVRAHEYGSIATQRVH